MLVARELGIEVGERRLLSGASVTLQAGDKVGLVGRNGAGKTTLLRTLAGELVPAEGAVLHRGRLGILSQESRPDAFEDGSGTALERILAAREIGALQRGIEEARRTMGEGAEERRDRAIRRFARLHDQFESRGGPPRRRPSAWPTRSGSPPKSWRVLWRSFQGESAAGWSWPASSSGKPRRSCSTSPPTTSTWMPRPG